MAAAVDHTTSDMPPKFPLAYRSINNEEGPSKPADPSNKALLDSIARAVLKASSITPNVDGLTREDIEAAHILMKMSGASWSIGDGQPSDASDIFGLAGLKQSSISNSPYKGHKPDVLTGSKLFSSELKRSPSVEPSPESSPPIEYLDRKVGPLGPWPSRDSTIEEWQPLLTKMNLKPWHYPPQKAKPGYAPQHGSVKSGLPTWNFVMYIILNRIPGGRLRYNELYRLSLALCPALGPVDDTKNSTCRHGLTTGTEFGMDDATGGGKWHRIATLAEEVNAKKKKAIEAAAKRVKKEEKAREKKEREEEEKEEEPMEKAEGKGKTAKSQKSKAPKRTPKKKSTGQKANSEATTTQTETHATQSTTTQTNPTPQNEEEPEQRPAKRKRTRDADSSVSASPRRRPTPTPPQTSVTAVTAVTAPSTWTEPPLAPPTGVLGRSPRPEPESSTKRTRKPNPRFEAGQNPTPSRKRKR